MTPINTDDEKPFLKYKMQLRESDRHGAPPYIYDHFLVPWAGHLNGSLVFAIVFVLIWVGIMIPLYRKRIFIKI